MLLTHDEIVKLIDTGVIAHAKKSHVNAASLDVVLGNTLWVEGLPKGLNTVIDLANKDAPAMNKIDLKTSYDLAPGEFCLADTIEIFNLPNDIAAEFRLKSSAARSGLNAALAMWCDPGWNGSVLTLELFNVLRYHYLRLRPGMKIGQMIFFRGLPVPPHASYATKGQYNNDISATPSKGMR